MKKDNKNVYILSLEASDIFSHMHRGLDLKHNYCGMIPYSLELVKLEKAKLNTKISITDKKLSRDIINVKFNTKVKDAKTITESISKKISKTETENKEYIQKLNDFLSLAKQNKNNWHEVG